MQKSLPLWDGIECFIDHSWLGQSLHDLAGVIYSPTYSDGIRATLRAAGPSGPLLKELAREMLNDDQPKPKIGFSADILFTAKDKEVQDILRVYSADLVFDPARGGAFIRALNQAQSQKGISIMSNQPATPTTPPESPAQKVDQMREEFQTLLSVQQEKEKQQRLLLETQQQMCGYLLDSALQAAQLGAPMEAHIRKQFSGKVFEASELTTAIKDARKLMSDLNAQNYVSGPRASQMYDTRDQLQAAVDDLLLAPREEAAKNLKVARLSGVKELYLAMTGDRDFYGAYYADRAMFQHTTATFTGLVKNALNKALVDHWGKLGRAGYDWWEKIATTEHFDTVNGITWMIFGTVASLPSVSEGAEYTELKIGDSPETSSFTKYGGYIGITLEALDRDDTRKLRAVPRELASAAIRNISSLVAAVFTDNSAVGPTMADTGALFNNTAVTTAGGHANLLTTALGTDYTAWNAIALAMYNQPMLVANETGYIGTGKKMALWPKCCLVPGALAAQAEALFVPRWEANLNTFTAQSGATKWGGKVEVVTVPEWTDATDYAAVADPALVPGIMIGERFGIMPEVFIAGDEQSPAVFMNDESRIKVRHFVAVGVADFRPLHKENVAG